jgi:hypothetical protein
VAVTHKWYGNAFKAAFNKEIDFNTDTIKVALLGSGYTPDQDAHDYFDDVVANEVAGGGYTAGGEALTTPTVTYDGATNRLKLDGDNVTFTSAPTARYAVVYVDTGVDGTSPLLSYVDFGQDEFVATITWHADGIAYTTVG